MSFFHTVKQLFLFLLIILVTPTVIRAIKRQYSALVETKSQVMIVPITGVITDASSTIKHLNSAFEDNSIKAILLTIDCSGSTAGSAEAIYSQIESLKRRKPKPVIGLIENGAISGGYWIACAADYLIAPGTALVGGINGTFKPCSPGISQENAQSKELIADTYQQFCHAVARSRKLSLTKIDQWAEGKFFTGQQAQKLHLIDAIGSAHHAAVIIKQKGLIEGEIEWVQSHNCDILTEPLATLSALISSCIHKEAVQ